MHFVGVDELRAIDGLTYLPLTSKSRLMLIVTVREFQRQLKHAPCFLDSRFYMVQIASDMFSILLSNLYICPQLGHHLWPCSFCDL